MNDEQKAAARYNCLALSCGIPQDPDKIVALAQQFYNFAVGVDTPKTPSTTDDIPF